MSTSRMPTSFSSDEDNEAYEKWRNTRTQPDTRKAKNEFLFYWRSAHTARDD